MIIPTLRIANKETYDNMINTLNQEDIKCLRVNMTRYSLNKYCEDIKYIREKAGRKLDIMADIPIPGRKYRILSDRSITVKKGDKVSFVPHQVNDDEHSIQVLIPSFTDSDYPGKIIIGDGELSLTVNSMRKDKIVASADHDGTFQGKKAFVSMDCVQYQLYDEEFLEEYLEALVKISPDKIVLSFSEDINILSVLRERILAYMPNVDVVPKIETQKGIDNCSEIMKAFKEVMLGRGDLALFSDLEKFGQNQEYV
ncbi:MAG: pyruvate kinase [Blautia sp.]|nr:pyruvate kinase [Blautia sp.]